jgi:sugar (pentulose or hexulose) kinase
MENKKRFIGFDLGAESGRCVVAILSNYKLILDEIHRFQTHNYFKDGEFHWDISKIFDEIIIGLKKAVKKHGNEFESIGIDTWGVDYSLVNKDSALLNNPFHYRDDRTDKITDQVFNIVSKEELYENTGIQTMQFNTIFQLFSEYNSKTSKIFQADKFLTIPDYLCYLLSGKKNAEYTIASTTGLTDQNKRDWHWETIEKLNYNKNIFPKIVQPGTEIGPIKQEVAKVTRLKPTLKLIATAEHDTASAVVSAPSRTENWAFLSSGTWSIMGVEVPKPVINKLGMKFNFSNEGGFAGTTRLCKNIIGMWPIQECKRSWQVENLEYSYPELTRSAEEIGYSNSWVDLNDSRFLKAGEMPNKVLAYLSETNQNAKNDVGYIIRVLLESLAFNYKIVFEEVEKVIDKKIDELNIIGGGIQNELLCQLTADALNIPVVAGPIEGTIIGNIGVQAIANKFVNDLKDWRKVVSNSFDMKIYEPKNHEYFELNKNKFLEVCKIY